MRTMMMATALVALVGCGGDDGGATTADLTDEERAEALWSELTGHESWGQPADWPGVQAQAVGSPHGPYVQIWWNEAAASSADSGSFADGSVLVKHVYDDADEATDQGMVIAMQKLEGYGSTNWFWAIYDASGDADPFGDVDMCTGCHADGQDYSLALTTSPGM